MLKRNTRKINLGVAYPPTILGGNRKRKRVVKELTQKKKKTKRKEISNLGGKIILDLAGH